MGFDSASRFTLVEQAIAKPGVCLITKTEKGPFVDTGIELNKFDSIWAEVNQARIYLSVAVLRELAEGAGILDEVRAQLIPNEVAAFQKGYAEGVEDRDRLDSLADRLDAAAQRFRSGVRAADPVFPGTADDAPDFPLVTDGSERRAVSGDAPDADTERGAVDGQGDGAGSDDGPALVPERPGDGDNPFRI